MGVLRDEAGDLGLLRLDEQEPVLTQLDFDALAVVQAHREIARWRLPKRQTISEDNADSCDFNRPSLGAYNPNQLSRMKRIPS
jgi:hypothetical protein